MAALMKFLGLGILLMSEFCTASDMDPISNCVPSDGDTILCTDLQNFCEDLHLVFIVDPDSVCSDGQRSFVDPAHPCSCNVLCVDSLPEGEQCAASYMSSYPDNLCAPGLDCMNSEQGGFVCSRNPAKPCVNLTIEYEAATELGSLGPGMLYPNCNDVGQFESMQCSASSTCYCTDTDGNRMFGEAAYTETDTMDCKCALHWQRNDKLGLTDGLRCLDNGNMDPLQCTEDFCYCYNSTRGAITQGPYDISQIPQLDCYDPSYHNLNYTNPCTAAQKLYEAQNPDNSDNIILGSGLKPLCGLDGFYSSKQPSDDTFYCSDKFGNPLEDFTITQADAFTSNCNCATRRHLMKQADITAYLPICCSNGNFNSYQTRGLYAYCVDDNGNQAGIAVPITDSQSLSCSETTC